MKTIWIINQDGSTPETGYGGRHHYFAQELGRRGYRVYFVIASWHHLLTNVDTRLPRMEVRDSYTVVRVPVIRYRHAQSKLRVINWEIFRFRLPGLLRQIPHPPDVIYYSSLSLVGSLGAEKLARRTGARLVFEVRDIWPLSLQVLRGVPDSHPYVRYLRGIELRAYARADAVISNLRNALDHMVESGMDANKFTWIPNGVSREEKATPESLPAHIAARLPNDKFIVGYTGSLNTANAPFTLVEAADLLREYRDIAFVIVGKGSEQAKLAQMISDRGLDAVKLIEAIPKLQVPTMLASFDACYIGLHSKPLFRYGVSPNKLFDYLASGRPILYGIDSGDYRPVEEAGAGFHVAPENPEALAEAILHLKSLPAEERADMGRRGIDTVENEYTYEELTDTLETVLFPEVSV
ncbi:MAG: glycosyltransferase family 4 protein [Marivivens sp.]|nr:glycosyltransferase family 4 protein [Marivivens sp.]